VLLEALGFTYSGEPRSIAVWPSSLRGIVSDIRLAARRDSFGIFYLVIPRQWMLGWERQVVLRILNTEPHSILVFTEPQHRLWHLVDVGYDDISKMGEGQ
jgi:hypothetical protein